MAIRKRKKQESCPLDMTPMIDVVFQLIIFFVVTINLADRTNPDIMLEKGPHGILIENKNMPRSTMTVEVDKRGKITINNMALSIPQFKQIVQARFNRIGEFPLLIRGDKRTEHQHIRFVMDMCTEIGLYKIWFAAIQKEKPKRDR